MQGTLAQHCEQLRVQLGYEAGTPFHEIVERACRDLGVVDVQFSDPLVQRAEKCCAALGVAPTIVTADVVAIEPVRPALPVVVMGSPAGEPMPGALVIESAWYGDGRRSRGKDVTHIVRQHIVNNEVRINQSKRNGALNEIFLGATNGCSEPNVRRANNGDSLWFPKCVIVKYRYEGSPSRELRTGCVAFEPFAIVITTRSHVVEGMTAREVEGCWLAFPGTWVFPPFPCAGAIGCHEVLADDHLKAIFWSPCLPFIPFIMHWRKEGDVWRAYGDECGHQGQPCCEQTRVFHSPNSACETGCLWNGLVWRMC